VNDSGTTWPTLDEARHWLNTGRGQGIKVAVLDSGIEAGHPGLYGLRLEDDVAVIDDGLHLRVVPGEGKDAYGHGTAVAGIIRQLAPEATLGSFRVLGQQLRSRSLIIRAAARVAIERGYHILNCSFGCSREDHVLFYKDWIDEAYVRGRHVVAACNGQDFTKPEWPGHFPTVVTVNFARFAQPEQFSCRRGQLIEFAARGEDLDVAWLGASTKRVTGSSFAAPHLTGLLARLISGLPQLSPLEAKALLQHLATG
jgi:subtilisin family serine protease